MPVRAVVALGPAPGRFGRLPGAARGQPGAIAGHRAGTAARAGGRTHQRTQFHHRDRPAGRDRGLGRQQRFGEPPLRHRHRGGGHGPAGDEPGQHAPHVGVEHGVPLAEGEAGHGRGGIAADPRQREQGVGVRRHHPAVPRGQDGRRLVQPERAPGVAEPAPLPDRLARGLGRERGRGGPPGDPGEVFGQHAGHRRLLQHDLTDQHRPGRRVGSAPGQVPRMARIPGQHRLGVGRRHDAVYRGTLPPAGSGGRVEPNGNRRRSGGSRVSSSQAGQAGVGHLKPHHQPPGLRHARVVGAPGHLSGAGQGRRRRPLEIGSQNGGERLADVLHLLHLHEVGKAVGALQGRS